MSDISGPTRDQLAREGRAMQGGRFPIRNCDDVNNAVRAIGRVRPNTEAARAQVRRFVIRRASALGCSNRIPDTWNSDGSLKS